MTVRDNPVKRIMVVQKIDGKLVIDIQGTVHVPIELKLRPVSTQKRNLRNLESTGLITQARDQIEGHCCRVFLDPTGKDAHHSPRRYVPLGETTRRHVSADVRLEEKHQNVSSEEKEHLHPNPM